MGSLSEVASWLIHLPFLGLIVLVFVVIVIVTAFAQAINNG